MFGPEIAEQIKAAAVAAYPNEMVGAIVAEGQGVAFRQLENRHPDPRHFFDCPQAHDLLLAGMLRAMVHSHPDGPDAPSHEDMAGQKAMDLPWGLVTSGPEAAGEPWWWGDMLEPPPLEGRLFRHGPSGTDGKGDCGALIRDYYRLERGILIPDFPRQDRWWYGVGTDLYAEHFPTAGFRRIDLDETAPEVGDVILLQINTPRENPVANHAGIHVGHGLMLHHLENRLSRREPILGWKKHIRCWLRHHAV